MKTITIAAPKGGTGKTTTATHLAGALAAQGDRALLIDLDPQGSATLALGMEPSRDAYHWITAGMKNAQRGPETVLFYARQARDRLDVTRGNRRLMEISALSVAYEWSADRIRQKLQGPPSRLYDWAIIDTTPAATWLQEAAIAAADLIIVPDDLKPLTRSAIPQTFTTAQALGLDARIRILPTRHDRRIVYQRQALAELRQHYPGLIYNPINERAGLAYQQAQGRLAWEQTPSRIPDAGLAYLDLAAKIRTEEKERTE